jgi:trans-aconitate methyltransferase
MDDRRSCGARFASHRMAANYRFRPDYSSEIYDILAGLLRGQPRSLLDAGCGPGKIVRGLLDQIDRADAVDPSAEMLHMARSFPAGGDPRIRWIRSRIEDAELTPPYGLIVAAASIHWMDVDRVLPRFREAQAPGAFLAVLDGDAPIHPAWEGEATRFMLDFLQKTNGERPKYWANASQRLQQPILDHPAFERVGTVISKPVQVAQNITDFLRCEHSRSTWSEDHLGEQASAQFDKGLRELLTPFATDDILTFSVQTRVEWGRILSSGAQG